MGQCCVKEEGTLNDQIIRSIQGDVHDYYDVGDKIGGGSMGAVYSCKPKPIRMKLAASIHGSMHGSMHGSIHGKKRYAFALKMMDINTLSKKYHMSKKEILNEINVLKELDHPYIAKCIETFEKDAKSYIITERCFGGDLFARDPYSEKEAATIISQILSAVGYMHSRNIIHRDLKFENILFESDYEDASIKIIDFGLAKKHQQNSYVTGFGGTVYTMAPEVVHNMPYTYKADMWSIGVLAYMLLASALPFECEDRNRSFSVRRKVTIEKIKKNKLSFKEERWKLISSEAKEFIKSLCKTNVNRRWTANEASKSAWIRNKSTLSDYLNDEDDGLLEKISHRLQDYSKASDLKKLGLLILAHRTPTNADIVQLRKVFQKLDYENDGVITVNEFKTALGSMYPESVDLDNMFHGIDVEQNGIIGYSEFLAATVETMSDVEENKLREVFSVLDVNNSGYVPQKKLKEILGRECNNGSMNELLNETDMVVDADVSVDDFLELFHYTKRKKTNTTLGPLMVS